MSQSVQMVDLQGQYQKIRAELEPALAQVLESCQFINGPAVKTFSANLASYLSIRQVIPCANGTDALQIALMALDLMPGDEVITAPFTFVATAEVIALLGLKPVFVDVDPDYFTLDPALLEAAITPRTRAIIPVHLFGLGAKMDEILQIAQKHNIPVVEDNAQSIGSDYIFPDGSRQKLGGLGHIGCTSFFPSKNLGGYGDGGALFTNDEELASKMNMIVNHGMKVRYYHDIVGVNSRLDTLQAVVLDVKLKRLDAFNRARQEAADRYDAGLAGIPGLVTPRRAPYSTHVFHQYTLRLASGRDRVMSALQEAGIPSAIYYPVPLHLQEAYRHYGYQEGDFPVSEMLCREVLSLPMHTELNESIQEYIIDHLKKAILS